MERKQRAICIAQCLRRYYTYYTYIIVD